MKKKRLAIISSYGNLCGIATYSEALRKNLSKYYDVTILSLNVEILRNSNNKNANAFIKGLAMELKNFDFVNIQFEAGIFGHFPRNIFKRFSVLAKAAKKLTVTMHTINIKSPILYGESLTYLTKGRLSDFRHCVIRDWKKQALANLTRKIIETCIKLDAPIIVHTEQDRKRLLISLGKKAKIFDYPLCYMSEEEAASYRNQVNRQTFLLQHDLPEDSITVGIFGFISPYKGIDTLIKCAKFLPAKYHFLIFGGQHPVSITSQPHGDSTLLEYVESVARSLKNKSKFKNDKPFKKQNLSLKNENIDCAQIHFLGSIYDHDEFVEKMAACDIVVLPYHEVGQSGSGIASLALNLGSNIICSQTSTFLQLKKYAGSSITLFSIGNYLELMKKIKLAKTTFNPDAIKTFNQRFNGDTNAKFYSDLIEGRLPLSDKKNPMA